MTPRRIVMGLEAGTASRDLEEAAALAERVGAELVGLFVEDANLLRFAALPFSYEIGRASALRRELDVAAMERSLRGLARDAERMLASTAGQSAIRWSFRVARGFAAEELLAAALEATVAPAAGGVRLFLLGDGESPARRWVEQARSTLAGRDAPLRVQVVDAADLADLDRAMREGHPGIVVLHGGHALLTQHGLPALLRETAAPVVFLPALATPKGRRQ